MQVQGKFRMQAHIFCGVVGEIAAFKVSHLVGFDIDATALGAASVRSSSIWGNAETVWEGLNCEHSPPVKQEWMNARTTNSQFKGAMEEMSRQGQKASTHIARC